MRIKSYIKLTMCTDVDRNKIYYFYWYNYQFGAKNCFFYFNFKSIQEMNICRFLSLASNKHKIWNADIQTQNNNNSRQKIFFCFTNKHSVRMSQNGARYTDIIYKQMK